MIKIGYVTHFAPIPSTKADPICVIETCHALSKAGITVELILPEKFQGRKYFSSEDEVWEFYGVSKAFSISQIKWRRIFDCSFLGRLIYKFFSILYAVQSGADVLYVRHVETALISSLFNKTVLLAHHDLSLISNWWAFRLIIRLSKLSKKILFLTVTHSGANLLQSLGVSEDKIVTAPNGINLDRFRSPNKELIPFEPEVNNEYKYKVLYSGSLYPGRGLEELFLAVREMLDVILIVIGGNPDELQNFKRIAKEYKCENILFKGFVHPNLVPHYLHAGDVLVLPYTSKTPTHRDMSPMKLFDYMASGKPIIATDFPVIREILKDKENAVLVSPDNSDAIRNGLQWIFDNPQEANSLGEAAKKKVENFTWEKRAMRIIEFLEKQKIN